VSLVPIDNLVPGMVLRTAVCDRLGRLLLPEAAELSEKHLKIFRTWGIAEVDVVGSSHEGASTPPATDPQIDPERLARAEADVLPRFVHADTEHPAVRELMRLCIEREARNAK
jgi:hypothetical protein